jgi:fatty acid desaturase
MEAAAAAPPPWNPLTEWKHVEIPWVRVKIAPADLKRFTERSDARGLAQALGFLGLLAATGATAYLAFRAGSWVAMAAVLYFHGTFYSRFGDARLDPFSSFLYWHMEYHIEHHMFAAIPCYRLAAFSRFVADQLPPREWSIPRLRRLHRACREKYGSWRNWRDRYGRFKGF